MHELCAELAGAGDALVSPNGVVAARNLVKTLEAVILGEVDAAAVAIRDIVEPEAESSLTSLVAPLPPGLEQAVDRAALSDESITAFVGVATTTMDETICEMIRLRFIRRRCGSSGTDSAVFELAPLGLDAARRIAIAQRERIARSFAQLPEDQHETAATLLDTLAYEPAAESTGFGINCAERRAFDARECVKTSIAEHGALKRAKRADRDPDLGEGPDDCPTWCSMCAPSFVDLGIYSAACA